MYQGFAYEKLSFNFSSSDDLGPLKYH